MPIGYNKAKAKHSDQVADLLEIISSNALGVENYLVLQSAKHKWSQNLMEAIDDEKILLLSQQGLQ
jgi:hypothetical protein